MARKRPKMPPSLRKLVYERDGFACRSCGWSPGVPDEYDGKNALEVRIGTRQRLVQRRLIADDIYEDVPVIRILVVDHVHPFSAGGSFDDPDNLQSLCSDCNGKKGAKV